MKKLIVSFFAGIVAFATVQTQTAKADPITNSLWTFETTAPTTAGPFNPEVGSGSALGHHAGTAAYSSPAGDGSAKSFSANGWAVGDYWQFQTTLDLINYTYSGFNVSFEQNGSGTGPRDFLFQYSTDGTTFNTVGSTYSLTSGVTWNSTATGLATLKSFDLSGITALNTASTVYFRIVDNSTTAINGTGTVGTGGTDRVDDFLITSFITPASAPEPSAIALASIGGVVALFAFRRRR